LPNDSIHSFKQHFIEFFHAFDFYDCKNLYKKNLNLQKAPDESVHDFHDRFIHLCFEFSKYDVDWSFLVDKFLYHVHISKNPHELEYFEDLPIYLSIRSSKFAANEVDVPSDPPSPSHQTTLVP